MWQKTGELYHKEFPRGSTVEIEVSYSIAVPGEVNEIRKYIEWVLSKKLWSTMRQPGEDHGAEG